MLEVELTLEMGTQLPQSVPEYSYRRGEAYGRPVAIVTLPGYRAEFDHGRVHIVPEGSDDARFPFCLIANEVVRFCQSGASVLNPRLCRECGQPGGKLVANEWRDSIFVPVGFFRCVTCGATWNSAHVVPEQTPESISWQQFLARQTARELGDQEVLVYLARSLPLRAITGAAGAAW